MVLRSKLFYNRTFSKSYIVLIGRNDFVWIFLGCLLDHLEEGRFHFFSVDDKSSTENLMTAVF